MIAQGPRGRHECRKVARTSEVRQGVPEFSTAEIGKTRGFRARGAFGGMGSGAGCGASREDQVTMKSVIRTIAQANRSAQSIANLPLKSGGRLHWARQVGRPFDIDLIRAHPVEHDLGDQVPEQFLFLSPGWAAVASVPARRPSPPGRAAGR